MSDEDEPEDATGEGKAKAEAEPEHGTDESSALPAQSLDERLTDAETALDAADTEHDLDDVEATLDSIEADLDAADLPEPDEDADEDAEDPRADLEARLSDLREDLESQRGPYAQDAIDRIADVRETITDTRWTEQGETEVADSVEAFLANVRGILDATDENRTAVTDGGEDETDDEAESEGESEEFTYEPAEISVDRELDALVSALEEVEDSIEAAALDPDADTGAIEALLEATDDLEEGIDDSQAFSDLSVRNQLAYEGFYDVLDSENRKDFPPEWNAIKIYERMGEIEPIMLAFEKLDSEFMEEHCMEAFKRMGASEAFDVMHQRAQRRKNLPIEVLGKIGDDRALETLHPYIEGDSDPGLQHITLKTIGEIGSTDSTQPVADRLVADDEKVRIRAARALGLIGDTRAIAPLTDVLDDDESDTVRASAAWALNQIGTEEALEAAGEHADDRSYIIQSEAQRASNALSEETSDTGESTDAERESAA
jgi:hypothetical protein